MLGRLLGGAKKRKKKTYTKPKKIKHKHKKIKLRILKFYKVQLASPGLSFLVRSQSSDHHQPGYPAGGRFWQGVSPEEDLPFRVLWPRHLHGYALRPCVLVGARALVPLP